MNCFSFCISCCLICLQMFTFSTGSKFNIFFFSCRRTNCPAILLLDTVRLIYLNFWPRWGNRKTRDFRIVNLLVYSLLFQHYSFYTLLFIQDSDSEVEVFHLLDPSVPGKVVGNISISCSVEVYGLWYKF